MLNFGWAELLVIGVVALIVIGPDDLPGMFRQLGRFTAKLRQMSREFSRAMEQAAKETGVKDVAADLKSAMSAKSLGLDAVKSAADKFEKWDPIKNAARPTNPAAVGARTLVPPPMPATPKPVVVDDRLEEADDLAEHEAPVLGAATQALYDKKLLRAQVLAEQTAKLRAIELGTYQPAPVIMPPAKVEAKAGKPARARMSKVEPAAVKPASKPRKSVKKADQA